MDKYRNMKNIKSAKVRVKIGSIDIMSLMIIVLVPIMFYQLGSLLGMGVVQSVIFAMIVFGLTLFCMTKTKRNPVEANIKVMLYALLMDQKRYFPLDHLRDYSEDLSKLKIVKKGGY